MAYTSSCVVSFFQLKKKKKKWPQFKVYYFLCHIQKAILSLRITEIWNEL